MKRISKISFIIYAAVSVFTFSGCSKDQMCDCLKGKGSTVTVERPVSPFHYVELNNKVNLYVHRAADYRITVTTGKKLEENINTEISDGILRINNKNKCNWVRNFNITFDVHIYLPVLDTLEVFESAGNIYFADTMYADRFSFQSWSSTGDYNLLVNAPTSYYALQTGPATLKVAGNSGVSYLWNQGQGYYDASRLVTDDIYATNRGPNNMYFNAASRIYARIEYSGNIYYGGAATDLRLDDYGGGNFIRIE